MYNINSTFDFESVGVRLGIYKSRSDAGTFLGWYSVGENDRSENEEMIVQSFSTSPTIRLACEQISVGFC